MISTSSTDMLNLNADRGKIQKRGRPKKSCCRSNPSFPWPRNRALLMASQANLTEEIVTIVVGIDDQQATFQWLKSVLELHSPFFIGAFEHSFKEANERKIELPEDDSDVFAEFLSWTSEHCLGGFGSDSGRPEMDVSAYYDLLGRLYIFADKYNMPRLQNVVIDTIMINLLDDNFGPEPGTVNNIYQNTMDSQASPLCRLLTNFVALDIADVHDMFRHFKSLGTPYCNGFTTDVLCEYAKTFQRDQSEPPRTDWWKTSRCSYHVPETELKH